MQYVRVDHQTKPEDLWVLMESHWQLPRPKMLISVTGGAKLSLKPRLKDSFKRGLINVTTSTGEVLDIRLLGQVRNLMSDMSSDEIADTTLCHIRV